MATIYQVKNYDYFEELLDYLYHKECAWKDRIDHSLTDDIWSDYKSQLGLHVDDMGRITYGEFKELVEYSEGEEIVKSTPIDELYKEDERALRKSFFDTIQNLESQIGMIQEYTFSDKTDEVQWMKYLTELYGYSKKVQELFEEYYSDLAYVLANDDE